MNRSEENSDSIPNDPVNEIQSRLPSKSVARFRCVSKLWGSMLLRSYFTQLFLTRSRARPRLYFALAQGFELSLFSMPQPQSPYEKKSSSPPVVLASFHMKIPQDTCPHFRDFASGLMFFTTMRISRKNGIKDVAPVIFNPTTTRYAILPELSWFCGSYSFLRFDPIDKQFKVLSMASYPSPTNNEHKVLTLGTGDLRWREIQCPLPCYNSFPLREGICINGVVYFLATRINYYKPHVDKKEFYMIVCFDVRSEKFKFIHHVEFFCFQSTKLVKYKGKLGGIDWKDVGNTFELRLWVLEDVEKQEWAKYVYTLFDDKLIGRTFLLLE